MACDTSERTLTELRIARAYVRLSCIPENSSETSVSLVSIGSCEIRMFQGPEVDFDGVPLFWLELFDHSTKTSVEAAIATGSKTLCLYSMISSRRQIV